MFEIEFYENEKGIEQIKDLLIELSDKSKKSKSDRIRFEKIITYIRVLQIYGTKAGEPYIKHIEKAKQRVEEYSNRS